MLTEFIALAMMKAKYELLENDEGIYWEIPGFDWVWANWENLEDCRKELKEVLEEWIVLKIRKKIFIPKVENYNLNDLVCEN